MTPGLPDALTRSDLPLAELASARLDGELFQQADAWLPIDTADSPTSRARSLRMMAPPNAVAERRTAAWIYGLGSEPSRHQFSVDVHHRSRKPDDPRFQLREVLLDRRETVSVGGLGLTTPLRTAADLARWGAGTGEPTDVELLARVLRYGGIDSAAFVRQLARRPRAAFNKVALVRLAEADRWLAAP